MEEFNNFNVFKELENDYLEPVNEKLIHLLKTANSFSDSLNIVQTIYKK
jgi:hypothetical protein